MGDCRKGGIYKHGIGMVAHPVISEHFLKIEIITGHVAHICQLSTQEAKARGSQNWRPV